MTSQDIADYLRKLQIKKGFSQQTWAELAGIPGYAVSRILSASIDAPSFAQVAALVKAAGGSLDELADNTQPVEDTPQHAQDMIDQKERSIVYLKGQVAELKDEVAAEKRTVVRLRKCVAWRTAVISVMLFIFGALAMWDLMDPRNGFLRRAILKPAGQSLLNVFKG